MGRGRKSKGTSDECVSGSSSMSDMDEVESQLANFGEAVDNLNDRSTAVRKESFQRVIAFLQRSFSPQLLETHLETLIANCMSHIKKNRSTTHDVLWALQALELAALTLGREVAELMKPCREEIKALFVPANSEQIRGATLQALSILDFVCNFDTVDAEDTLQELADIFNCPEESSLVKEAALEAFGLTLVDMDSGFIARDVAVLFLEELGDLLHDDCLEVQRAAGTLLALISEARLEHIAPEEDDLYNVVAMASSRIEELSHENSKSLSRKSKAKVRSTFREIFSSIDAGEPPSEVVQAGKEKIVCNTWPAVFLLQSLRGFLCDGLINHLKDNPLLRAAFEEELVDKGEKLVGREKRLLQSSNSMLEKQRSLHSHQYRMVLREEAFFEQGCDL